MNEWNKMQADSFLGCIECEMRSLVFINTQQRPSGWNGWIFKSSSGSVKVIAESPQSVISFQTALISLLHRWNINQEKYSAHANADVHLTLLKCLLPLSHVLTIIKAAEFYGLQEEDVKSNTLHKDLWHFHLHPHTDAPNKPLP